ncbi:hypothetical protein, partial [Escherichia coli]|uniref:hypothetical protein n=1 Tax=Escherichia coli TaxID=562 RepID=UPI001BC8361E
HVSGAFLHGALWRDQRARNSCSGVPVVGVGGQQLMRGGGFCWASCSSVSDVWSRSWLSQCQHNTIAPVP